MMPVLLQIDLHGQVVSKEAKLTVAATDTGFSATSSEPILLNAAEFGLEDGVAALQSVAGLDAISRVIPVTVSFNFAKVAAASP